jgi:hypothetical protein
MYSRLARGVDPWVLLCASLNTPDAAASITKRACPWSERPGTALGEFLDHLSVVRGNIVRFATCY